LGNTFFGQKKGESVMGKKQFNQKQKLEILKSAGKVGLKEAANLAQVHYTTVYQWQRMLDALGEEGFLAYKPSTPGRGIKKVSAETEQAVLSTRKRYPGFGPGQIRNQLRRQKVTVSIKTVRKIMEANGYESSRKKRGKKEWNLSRWIFWSFLSTNSRCT